MDYVSIKTDVSRTIRGAEADTSSDRALGHYIQELWHPSQTELKRTSGVPPPRGHVFYEPGESPNPSFPTAETLDAGTGSCAELRVLGRCGGDRSVLRGATDHETPVHHESAGVPPRRRDPGRSATTSPGRRLAAMAGAGPDRPVQRGRAPAAMAAVGTAAGLDRVEPRHRLWLGGHQGRSHLRPELERQAEHRGQPEPRRRKGCLVESAGTCGQQRSGIGSAGDADHRRRPPLRADGERRLVVFESGRRRRGLAAQHSQGLQRPEHPVAAERITAGRRQHGDRDAGRTERRHGGARQDVGRHDLDREGTERRGRLRIGDRRRRAGRPNADDDHRQRRGRRARSPTAS